MLHVILYITNGSTAQNSSSNVIAGDDYTASDDGILSPKAQGSLSDYGALFEALANELAR